MRRTVPLLATMALTMLVAGGVALAAAGDLDPSFGEGGTLIVEQNGGLNDVAVQPDDGKIVSAGSTPGDGRRHGGLYGKFLLVRSLPGGTPDDSFGGGDGIVTTDIRGSSDTRLNASDGAEAMLIQPDRKIVAAGSASGGTYETRYSHFALARYTPDGTLDETFGGGDGMVRTDVERGSSSAASSLIRLPNGKLVAAGWARGKFALARYRADGRLDKRFGGGDGIVLTNVGGDSSDRASELVFRPDGDLVAAGSVDGFNDGGLARYNSNGTLDQRFGGGDGKVVVTFDLDALVRLPDNRLVVGGSGIVFNDSGDKRYGHFVLSRLKPNGAVDGSFGGGDGIVYTNGVLSATLTDLDRQPNDKLIASGSAPTNRFALVRYHPGGCLDDTFGVDGRVLTEFRYAYAFLGSPVRQGDGKLVAAGTARDIEPDGSLTPYRVMLARFLGE